MKRALSLAAALTVGFAALHLPNTQAIRRRLRQQPLQRQR